jgi:hypothetical protein
MRADSACDVAESVASRCSAHKTVGARADAAAIDVSRKKWRRDGAELITFFIVQPRDGARRRASASRWARRSLTFQSRRHLVGTLMTADKLWANFHGLC